MGKTILVDPEIENYIQQYIIKQPWRVGLILGVVSQQKDHALHLVVTPPKEEEDESPESSQKKSVEMETLDEKWMCVHAKQVQKMLPGGLDVIGVFVMAPQDGLRTQQDKMRQVLFAISKSLTKEMLPFQQDKDSTHTRTLLQICTTTRKVVCKTYDTADPRAGAKPADWKYSSSADKLTCLHTKLTVNVCLPVTMNAMKETFQKRLQESLEPYCLKVWNSIGTIAHQLQGGGDSLDSTQVSKKKGKQREEDQSYGVELFFKSERNDSDSSVQSMKCGATIAVQGSMAVKAYVSPKSNVEESLRAVKVDAIRSLMARCQMLCEDFLQPEEEQDKKGVYGTPMRIFVPIKENGKVNFCDYIFPDEDTKYSIERCQELLELTVDEEAMDLTAEKFAGEGDLEEKVMLQDPRVPVSASHSDTGSQSLMKNCLVICISLGIGILAVGIGILLAVKT